VRLRFLPSYGHHFTGSSGVVHPLSLTYIFMYARGCFRSGKRVGTRTISQFSYDGRQVLVVACLLAGVRVWVDGVELARGVVQFGAVVWQRSDERFSAGLAALCARDILDSIFPRRHIEQIAGLAGMSLAQAELWITERAAGHCPTIESMRLEHGLV
jgi:hypothetical protein